MRQLSGLDTSFLSLETASTPLHVASVVVVDPDSAPNGFGYEQVRDLVQRRLHLLPPFRWRLVEVPFGIDHPYWIEDADFDVEFHLRHAAIPPPGGPAELSEVVSRIHARPLDRRRPLWEMYVIEGLADGRIGIMTKMHHAAVDGVSGAEILVTLLDLEPDPGPEDPPEHPPVSEMAPSQARMLLRGGLGLIRQPRRAVKTAIHTARALPGLGQLAEIALPRIARLHRGDGGMLEQPTLQAPPTPFNAMISPHRIWAYGSLSLQGVKDIKNAAGATVNDVVMTICGAALRRYLIERDALPGVPLQAMVPISVRGADEGSDAGNRVTAMAASLPTHIADPLERLTFTHDTMQVAKRGNAVPADLLQDFTQFAFPAVAARAARVVARTRWAERARLPFNVVVSNVPGPPVPLYFAGARLEAVYPVSAIADGLGLNITIMSYLDNLEVGIVADREIVPDLWKLMDYLRDAQDELAAAVAASPAMNLDED